jgi:hypothetical protein
MALEQSQKYNIGLRQATRQHVIVGQCFSEVIIVNRVVKKL